MHPACDMYCSPNGAPKKAESFLYFLPNFALHDDDNDNDDVVDQRDDAFVLPVSAVAVCVRVCVFFHVCGPHSDQPYYVFRVCAGDATECTAIYEKVHMQTHVWRKRMPNAKRIQHSCVMSMCLWFVRTSARRFRKA